MAYITDLFNWRYIFFLNLIPGAIMLPALFWGLGIRRRCNSRNSPSGDWYGVFTIAVGLGALQIVLEEGNKDDWFGSTFIVRTSIISVVAMARLLLIIELRKSNKSPLVNLRLFKDRETSHFVSLSNARCSASCCIPRSTLFRLYLSQSHGYSARQSGEVLAWAGLPQLAHHSFHADG